MLDALQKEYMHKMMRVIALAQQDYMAACAAVTFSGDALFKSIETRIHLHKAVEEFNTVLLAFPAMQEETIPQIISYLGDPAHVPPLQFVEELRALMRVTTDAEMRHWAKIVGERT